MSWYRAIKSFAGLVIGVSGMMGCYAPKEHLNTPGNYKNNWWTAHADSRNSDYSPVQGGKQLSLLWQRKFNGTINLGPTTNSKGQVYVTTSAPGCHLFALDARTGEQLWCTDKVNKYAVASSALIDEENRIFIADDKAMHAFDENGKLLWQSPIRGFPLSAQFTHTGKLLFITHIGNVYVMEKNTGIALINGQALSAQTLPDTAFNPLACMQGTEACPCANTLAYNDINGSFYFTYWEPGTAGAALWAMQYNESNGGASVTKLWENNSLPGGSASSPDLSANGSRLYVNDNAGNLYAIAAADGSVIWKYALRYNTGGSQSTSPDGYIMPAGAKGASLMCLKDEGDTARLVWQDSLQQNRGVATQAAGHVAYVTVASPTGRFYNNLLVTDVLTGKVLDKETLPGKTFFTVGTTVGPDGTVYVPSFNGYLYAFRKE